MLKQIMRQMQNLFRHRWTRLRSKYTFIPSSILLSTILQLTSLPPSEQHQTTERQDHNK